MFETNFSEHNKIWGAHKRFGVTAPMSAGLGGTVARSLPLGTFMFLQGG